MIRIPTLRLGEEYQSLDVTEVKDCRTGEVLAEVSTVNGGIVRRDLTFQIQKGREALKKFTVQQLMDISKKAADIFMNGTVPCGDTMQSAEDYVKTLSKTSGLPHNMCRANMAKVFEVMDDMSTILKGLTRSLDLSVLDKGCIVQDGVGISYTCEADSLGVVLPSNSPGVNSLWIPALILKVPVVLKPGREEPWTPLRLIQCLIAAGCPKEAFGYYPTDHDGADSILNYCGKGIVFGDKSTTDRYKNNLNIEKHGPGYSKIIIGEDKIDDWPELLDELVASVSKNSGRSCINTSGIVVPRHGEAIAKAISERLAEIVPSSVDDEKARLSAFANPAMANWIDSTIEDGLKEPGAIDYAREARGSARKQEFEGATYVLPSVIYCDSFEHPLANREFMCPYVGISEVPQDQMLEKIGPSLVLSVFSDNEEFIGSMFDFRDAGRLNLNLPTTYVSWDQPHEGNLFEFLYTRKAIQVVR
ncbi:MAG: aldehyde dehydrogenase family protein [Lentisphaeraceae bacterium]|nr:aldehyde dehydrogenase family protein [Lentisphaeraceae bacterium]